MSISPDQIALTPNQKQHLARLAEQSGRPWNAVLEEALSSFEHEALARTENGETVYDAMLRLGLLGSVKDGPPDLSTNPKYMEGFGEHGQ
jgi:hypothetical protein